MAKYSTGNSDRSDRSTDDPNAEDASCTVCGAGENLTYGEQAGVEGVFCDNCLDLSNQKKKDYKNSQNNSTQNTELTEQSASNQEDVVPGFTIGRRSREQTKWVTESRSSYGNVGMYMEVNYGAKVREELDRRDLSVEEAAEFCGVDVEVIGALKDGDALEHISEEEKVEKVEEALGISLLEVRSD